MTDIYMRAKRLAYSLLESVDLTELSQAGIEAEVETACDLVEKRTGESIGSLERERMKREIESEIPQVVEPARVLSDGKHKEWLESREASIDWAFWSRYRSYLEGRIPPASLDALDESTRTVLALLEDPLREGRWDRRGLVVGQVQSGKTGHYTGLINRASDAGYKLIVVLAGMHNSLRSQTQVRLDDGFLGWTSGTEGRPPSGAGKGKKPLRADTITTRLENGDFKKAVAENFRVSIGKVPLLFVVKKNVTVLTHLVKWVRTLETASDPDTGRVYVPDTPILVIDDEADQASVDTKKGPVDEYGDPDPDHDPTKTNKLIRQLLYSFDKSCYIGYTATPFANIFIHDKGETSEEGADLFPRSFIVGLEAPSNYVGPAQLFGLSADDTTSFEEVKPLPLTRQNGDGEKWVPQKHKPSLMPRFSVEEELPPSLERAILDFVLAGAARAARGQGDEHHSMLVHVTRFVEVQHHIRAQVKTYVTQLRRMARRGTGSAPDVVRGKLKEIWEADFVPTTTSVAERLPYKDPQVEPMPWETVEPHILPLLEAIHVYEINGKATDALEYEQYRDQGLKVIAVGGAKLSRGLTLEGLATSYFLRPSRMYDTLMQMGRWFGYRPGYVDLCRLYLPSDLREAFEHITLANEELHREFGIMEGVKATPADYGLRVLSHPTLQVTAPGKMRSGELDRISFGGRLAQTVVFYADRDHTYSNYVALQRLVGRLGEPKPRKTTSPNGRPLASPDNAVWDEVAPEEVMGFLREYGTHDGAFKIRADRMADYIARQNALGELTSWTVALISNTTVSPKKVAGLDVGLTVRETGEGRSGNSLAIRALVSGNDEQLVGITDQERSDAKLLAERRLDDPSAEPGGVDLRNARSPERGLLLIYPLDPTKVGGEKGHPDHHLDRTDDTSHPLVGIALSFPGSKKTPARDFLSNQVAQRERSDDV